MVGDKWPAKWTKVAPGPRGWQAANRDTDWMERAACAGCDPEVWFPADRDDKGLRPSFDSYEAAKRVCRRCPVQVECLQWALDNGQDYGVWGGVSASDREDMRRDRRRK